MKLLAFDTSTIACSVALLNGKEVHALHKIAPMQQAKLILPMIDELLTSHSLDVASLDGIAYGAGPGSFTGIRIASSVAQGLGYAAQKPLIPISSLAAAALTAYQELQWTKLLIAIDARVNKIYWAAYEITALDSLELKVQEQLCTPDQILIPEGNDWRGIGDGWEKYQEILQKHLTFKLSTINSTLIPNAKAILPLAKLTLEQGRGIESFHANPVYLR